MPPIAALTCSAIKPLGMPANCLAELAGRFALGEALISSRMITAWPTRPIGPLFSARVPLCAAAVRRGAA